MVFAEQPLALPRSAKLSIPLKILAILSLQLFRFSIQTFWITKQYNIEIQLSSYWCQLIADDFDKMNIHMSA